MRNYGFKIPVITPEDYHFGSGKLGSVDLNPAGDWTVSLPRFEPQRKRIETSACVTYTILSDIETLEKFQYGIESNYSDRYIAKLSGTDPASGNDPKTVCATIRKYGLVNEEDYPFVDDVNEYYKEIPQELIAKGKKWLEKNDFGYEWVDPNKIETAIKRSPVSVAVYAWSENEASEFIRLANSNHYTLNYAIDSTGRLLVFDSYENPYLKTLAKDHTLEYCQMYTLRRITQKKRGFWQRLREWLW